MSTAIDYGVESELVSESGVESDFQKPTVVYLREKPYKVDVEFRTRIKNVTFS
jgi:hypothetical protein